MALPLTINNPQEQLSEAEVNPSVGYNTNNYSGNVIGSGSSSASATPTISNILIYGVIALVIVWVLQRLDG